MDTLTLLQKQGYTRNEFHLMDETLSVRQFTITEHKEWVVRLENIGHQIVLEKDTSFMKIFLILFLGLSSFLWAGMNAYDHSNHMAIWVWMPLTIFNLWIVVAIHLSPLTNELRLGNESEGLVFLTDKPSEKEVREFVEEIIHRSKKILLKKYSPDPDLPEELTISNLNWLLEIEVIDNKIFNEMKANYYLKRNRFESNND